jgi:RNA polymerase sigma-70 factor (ECF subfamily)
MYWYPVYTFVRQRGHDPDTAMDLVQSVFSRLLEKKSIKAANKNRGKFRSFLLTAFKFHLSDEAKHDRAQKRGGGIDPVSLDRNTAENRYRIEPADAHTPETLFERRWAMTLLAHAMERLRGELNDTADPKRSLRLVECLTGETPQSDYRRIAEEFGMTEASVRVAVHRLRRRYGKLLREEVGRTVADPDKIDSEIRHVFDVLECHAGGP